MEIYKTKSLTPAKTDKQLEQSFCATRFISFEAAIRMFRKEYNLTDKSDDPIGYRVTEQGIEIIQS